MQFHDNDPPTDFDQDSAHPAPVVEESFAVEPVTPSLSAEESAEPLSESIAPASESEPPVSPLQQKIKVLQPKKKSSNITKLQPSELRRKSAAYSNPSQLNASPAAGSLLHSNPSESQDDWWAARKNISSSANNNIFMEQGSNANQPSDISKQFLEPSQSLLMYWLDAFEGKDGLVYLFGKVNYSFLNIYIMF